MIAGGLPVPLIGAHPLASSQYARLAGDAAIGSYYTLVGPNPAAIRQAASFMRDYRAAYRQPAGRISLAAFDATTIVIRALSRVPAAELVVIGGTPDGRDPYADQLRALAAHFELDEIVVNTRAHDPAVRRHSYALLAREFGLAASPDRQAA